MNTCHVLVAWAKAWRLALLHQQLQPHCCSGSILLYDSIGREPYAVFKCRNRLAYTQAYHTRGQHTKRVPGTQQYVLVQAGVELLLHEGDRFTPVCRAVHLDRL